MLQQSETDAPVGGRQLPPERPGAERRRRDGAALAMNMLGKFGLPMLLVLLVAFFSMLEPDSFFSVSNFRAILDNQTIVVVMAFGAMATLIVGQFDISIASVVTLSHVLAVGFIGQHGLNPYLAVVLTIALMAAFGLVNGLIVVMLRVDAFVATLATSTIGGGLALWYSGGKTIFEPVPESFTDIARHRVAGVPLPVIYVAVLGAVMWFVLSRLPLGRRMYVTGGNMRAAELAGIPVRRYLVGAFVVSAAVAGFAGVLLGSRLGTASPTTGGSLLLPAYAGALLGATTVRPGRYNVVGTIVAVYTLAVTVSGLQQVGAPVWVEPVFNGSALVIAIALSGWAVRMRAQRAKRLQLERLEAG